MNAGQFFTENWTIILSGLITLASLIVAVVQAVRTGNKKALLALNAKIPQLVIEAEQLFGKGNGLAKLNSVLTDLRVFAIEHNLKVDKEYLIGQIESVVAATKNVNVNATPSTEVEVVQANTPDNERRVENCTSNSQVDVNI